MRFDVISVLPAMFAAITDHGVVGRALSRELWSLHCWNPRDYADDAYKTIDDRPYGGGPGMVMMAQPLRRTLAGIRAQHLQLGLPRSRVVYLSPQGLPIRQAMTERWASGGQLTLLCGRYEGVDQRLLDAEIDEEISVGDFVVSGGELPAMMLIDAIVRQLPGALSDSQSAEQDSFMQGLLDHPQYTRPETIDEVAVPSVLLSGHHLEITRWRREQALAATGRKRPELLRQAHSAGRLSKADLAYLASQNLTSVLDLKA